MCLKLCSIFVVSLLASTCDGGGVVFENAKDEAAAKLKLASSSVEGTMDGDKIVFDTVIPQRNDYNGTANAASGSITEAEDEPLVTYNETLNHLNLFENFVQTKKLFIIELAFLKGLRKLRKQLRTIKNEKTSSEDSWRTLLEARELKGHMQNLTAPLFEGGEFAVPLDYTGAKKGILILHDTYSFDLAALAKGKTVSRNYPNGPLVMKNDHNMEVEDFYQLTQQAFAVKWYDRAIDFLRAAFKLFDKLPKDSPKRPSERRLERMKKMRRNLVQLNNHQLYREKAAVNEHAKTHMYIVTDKLGKKKDQPDFILKGEILGMSNKTRMGKDAYFRAVCNGFSVHKFMQMPPREKPGRCGILHHFDPYLRLAPFNIEVVSRAPYIITFPEFFHEKEIDWLIEYSTPRLSRNRHVHDPHNEEVEKERREFQRLKKLGIKGKKSKKTKFIHKSVQTWMGDIEYEVYYNNITEVDRNNNYTIGFPNLYKLSKRLELASGLNVTAKYASTDYQTTNYGLGGLCEIHTDPGGYLEGQEIPKTEDGFRRIINQGDMIATFMGWLGDVPAGGATGFCEPLFETTVWPVKGSIAFWYDLDKKGHRDYRTLHGGCPILSGSKWILNKWIYYYDQMFKLPCNSRDPEAKQRPFAGVYR